VSGGSAGPIIQEPTASRRHQTAPLPNPIGSSMPAVGAARQNALTSRVTAPGSRGAITPCST
jgi:hypothetical protein